MVPGRVRRWEWITGLAGIVLLVSLFLPWYGAEGFEGTANAWESFAVVDFILALAALLAIAHPIVTATQGTASVPQTIAAFVVWFALIALVAVLIRLLSPPGVAGLDASGAAIADTTRAIGLWLGTLATAAILAAGWKSMRDKAFPAALRPALNVETIATPAADGERRDAPR